MGTVSELMSQNISNAITNVQTWGGVIYNVKAYGAKGDGVTDDTLAIQAAIDAAEEAGGGIVFFPQGNYKITSTLTVTGAVILEGNGKGDNSSGANGGGVGVSRITWGTVVGSTMIQIKSSNINYYLFSPGMSNLLLDGANAATRGIYAASVAHAFFDKVQVRRCTEAGFVLDGGNGALSSHNIIKDYHYVWGSNAVCENSHGFVLGNNTDEKVAQTYIQDILTFTKNGHGILIYGADNNIFEKIQGFVQSPGTGKSLYFANGVVVARNNLVKYISGSIHAESQTYGNRIEHFISEGAGISVDEGAQIHYTLEDYVTSEIYTTHKYVMTDQKEIPVGAIAIIDGASAGISASQWACYNLPDSANSRLGIFIPPPYSWDNGILQTLRIWFTTNTANTSAQWTARIKALINASGSALSTPEFDQTINIPVIDLPNRSQFYDVSINLSYTRGEALNISIQRSGADANDTALGNIQILGAVLIYQSTGPDSAGSGTFDVTFPYK